MNSALKTLCGLIWFLSYPSLGIRFLIGWLGAGLFIQRRIVEVIGRYPWNFPVKLGDSVLLYMACSLFMAHLGSHKTPKSRQHAAKNGVFMRSFAAPKVSPPTHKCSDQVKSLVDLLDQYVWYSGVKAATVVLTWQSRINSGVDNSIVCIVICGHIVFNNNSEHMAVILLMLFDITLLAFDHINKSLLIHNKGQCCG